MLELNWLNSQKAIWLGIGVLVIFAAVPSVYFYIQYRKTQQRLANPAEFARVAAQELVAKVGRLIDLPADEEPTIATVSDVDRLREQPFFTKAKNGDKVLIYANARLAILYDPQVNKILNVAPLNIGSPSGQIVTPTPSPTSEPTPKKKAK